MLQRHINMLLKENNLGYFKALKLVFVIHVIMFVVTFIAASIAKSSALYADSLDFIGDAASYFISFYVLGRSQILQSMVALSKAVIMMLYGIPVLYNSLANYNSGLLPQYEIMSVVGFIGIFAHIICIYILMPFQRSDSNRLSVWICTINDLLCNVLTVLASFLVMKTQSILPDTIVSTIIVAIAFLGAFVILKQSIKEIKQYKNQQSL